MTTVSPKIAIIDYGVGNLYSISKALKHFTDNVIVTDEKEEIGSSNALVLPGVGSFEAGMSGLRIRGLTDLVKDWALANKPMLGICLGAQLMLSRGYEFGDFEGLDLIPGRVVAFPKLLEKEKIPHIGWNKILPATNQDWRQTIFESIPPGASVYFVHSFILEPERMENILSYTNYGGYQFCSAIKSGNIYGCQFHPEKSGRIGLLILKNFLNIIKTP